jgi:hypothetical protein
LKEKKQKQIIGKSEIIDFPDLGLFGIHAKVDTGAYTSALHCHDIHVIDGILYFKFLDPSHPVYSEKQQKFSQFWQKDIKNSFGETEKRYIIKTRIRIGKRVIKSVISLTNRGTMRFPVLIGRKLLKKRFIVDVDQENILPVKKKKTKS